MKKPRFDTASINFDSKPKDSPIPDALADCWRWVHDSKKLGLVCCCVIVHYSEDILTFAGPRFERILGNKLEAAKLGFYEDITRGQPFIIFYLLPADRLTAALDFIKAELAGLKILPECTVGLAEPDSETWRRAYPANGTPATDEL